MADHVSSLQMHLAELVATAQRRWGANALVQGARGLSVPPPLPSGLAPLDTLLGGSLPRGVLSELLATPTCGMTSIALRALAEPTSDPARLHALLGALLRELEPGVLCEQLEISVDAAPLTVTQRDLFAPARANAEQLEEMLARLSLTHGNRLLRATLADPDARCLERRVQITPREDV